ncbi:acid-sensing ion channel 1-like isoform X4 [Lampetra fluviatilis]
MDLKVGSEDSIDSLPPSNLQAFANSSTLHGINHIFVFGRLSVRRAIWTLAFLGSLGLLLLECAERVQYFFEYPHVTALDEVAARRMNFPAVTFCNLNEFRFSRMTRNDLYHAGWFLALLNERLEVPDPDLVDPHILAQLRERADFRNFKSRPFSMREFYERTGHELKDMMLNCKFRGVTCTPSNFTTVFTRYGKCYMFNSGKDGRPLLTTLKGGTGNGLEIMLDIQQDEYLPVWGETDFFDTYSITACRIDCETRYVVENCNCRMVHMPGDAPYCTPEQYKECADPALDFLVEKDDNFCVCDTPCNTTRYGKELSMVKIPSKASAKYLAKKYNKTEDYIRENVLVLDIFFEALNYETIEQKKAYEVAGLLGDIGGQMGLFIGASILTILEIFDYLYEVLKDKVCKCRKKHNKKRSENMTPCETLRSHHSQDVHFNSSILPHHTVRGTFEDFAC